MFAIETPKHRYSSAAVTCRYLNLFIQGRNVYCKFMDPEILQPTFFGKTNIHRKVCNNKPMETIRGLGDESLKKAITSLLLPLKVITV